MDAQIAATLTAEGYQTPRLAGPFTSKMVWHLREKWKIPTVKLNGNERSPAQWEDGSYSVEGAAARLGVDPGTIYSWLRVGKLAGSQLAKGMRRIGLLDRRRCNTASRMASTSQTIKERGRIMYSRKWLLSPTP
jgi:hypothetical protein